MERQAVGQVHVVLVGAGNVATHLGRALQRAGHVVKAVYSRTEASARLLSGELEVPAFTSLEELPEADLYVLSVKDDALSEVVSRLCPGREGSMFVHTAGSVSLSVFANKARQYGVIYPLQTFSRRHEVDFAEVPLFVEASDGESLRTLLGLARSLSRNVVEMDGLSRARMHLSAVFVCNFVNHLYALGEQAMEQCGLSFELLLPLIDETARKVHVLSPRKAQTGPAVRGDESVMARQEAMIDSPVVRQLYRLMSKSIENISR